jgi:hypothetical protein
MIAPPVIETSHPRTHFSRYTTCVSSSGDGCHRVQGLVDQAALNRPPPEAITVDRAAGFSRS